jgi:RNA polymerase sigma-70 factor (ECF subfamily)
VGDAMAAEDITSEAIFHLWQTTRKEEVVSLPALLLTILRNNTLNYLKHQEVKHQALKHISSALSRDLHYRITSLEACDPQEVFSAEITEIVEKTLHTLPPLTRRVFEMSRHEHQPAKEIARQLSIHPKSVEYHITQSLKALRIALKEYLPFLYWMMIFHPLH